MFFIHFTTIPSRINHLSLTIQSWLQQTIADQISKIVITIPKISKRFGEYDLSCLEQYKHEKIEFQIIDTDYGPSTKIVGAILYQRAHPELECVICDDDLHYHSETLCEYVNIDKEMCYTHFHTRNFLQIIRNRRAIDYNHILGADTFYLPKKFFETTKKYDYVKYIENMFQNCPDIFCHDDYLISLYLYQYCQIPCKQVKNPKRYQEITIPNTEQIHLRENNQNAEYNVQYYLKIKHNYI